MGSTAELPSRESQALLSVRKISYKMKAGRMSPLSRLKPFNVPSQPACGTVIQARKQTGR
ncbi:hypothetical protein BaRGS_00036755, partial [Batillaria attramentaria]